MKKLQLQIALILCLAGTVIFGQNPIMIPDTIIGPVYNLEAKNDSFVFKPGGQHAPTMGYNGSILGPTLIMDKGDIVNMRVLNSLGEETTVHWHGLHVAPENDGGPHSVISPNDTMDLTFKIHNSASTNWYHPHLHHFTLKQVALGLSGFIIVRDTVEAALNLPRTYGVDDFPLVIQSKAYRGSADTLIYRTVSTGSAMNMDSLVLVNATYRGTLDVPKQMVRLRLLNGSHHRVFDVGLSNNASFYQIASDGGLLEARYQTTRARISPGERVEIVVDFSSYSLGQKIQLKSYASELPNGVWGAERAFDASSNEPPSNYHTNPYNGVDFNLMEFNIIAQTTSPITSIPQNLVTVNRIPESQANVFRHKYLIVGGSSGGGLQIGNSPSLGLQYDINIVNDTVQLNDTEIWSITSEIPSFNRERAQYHPFHIHDVQFYILDRKDSLGMVTMPHPGEMGLKDVVLVYPGETVRFIAKFTDFVSDVPYVYHCHILPHEDSGMMAQFIVRSHNIYVDKNFVGVETGKENFPFNTFTEAINAAGDGSTIIFKSNGDHDEIPPILDVNKKVNIVLTSGVITIK